MKDIMQTLFDYIIDYTHETYCLQNKRTAYSVLQDSARSKLEEQLTEEQLKLFDEFLEYSGKVEMEELYAMFLATFDQSAALLRRHTA